MPNLDNHDEKEGVDLNKPTTKRRGRPVGLRKGPDGKWYKANELPGSIHDKPIKPKPKKKRNSKPHQINYDSDDGPSHEDLLALEEELSQEDMEHIKEFKDSHDNSDILVTDWLDFPDHIRMRQIITNPEWGLDKVNLIDKPLVSTKYVVDKFQEYKSIFGCTTDQLIIRPIESFIEDSCKVFNNGIECDSAEKALSIFFTYLQNAKPRTLYYLYTVSDTENYSTPIGIVFRDKPFKAIQITKENIKTSEKEVVRYLQSNSGFYIIHPTYVATTPEEFLDYYDNTVFLSLKYFITANDITFTGIGINDTTNLYWGWQDSEPDSVIGNNYKTSYQDLINNSKQLFDISDSINSDDTYEVDDEDKEDEEDDDESFDDNTSFSKHSSYLDMNIDDYYDNLIDKPSVKSKRDLTDDDIYYPGTNKDKRDFENLSDGGFRKTNHGLSDDNGFDNYNDDQ